MTYYLARRFLGLFPWEWDRLPHWTQRIYREGLEYERPWVTLPMMDKTWDPFDEETGAFEYTFNPEGRTGSEYIQSTDGLLSMGFSIQQA